MTKRHAPVIGFTLDHETAGGYSKMPWYAIRENYLTSVSEWGATPLALPHEISQVEVYVNLIDGLVTTGGAFDISPEHYGVVERHSTVITKDRRTAFELAITRAMVKANKPVLGICGGQQLLNVAFGGTLIQHIPDAVENALAHEQPNPRTEPGHDIKITKGTLLHKIAGTEHIAINSAHHQAVDKIAPGFIVDAVAPDGVIEGIEMPDHKFCLGVQWHPEYHVHPADKKIFEAFIAACA